MPNWVTNYLTVEKEIAKEYILNKENEVDFEILCPMPKELENTDAPCMPNEELLEKYGASNWYDWHVKNWGTKWNASNTYVEDLGDGRVRIEFDTPWSTPYVWLMALRNADEFDIDYHLAWIEEQGYRGIEIALGDYYTEFELPMVEWEEDEHGDYISSEENEPFDWRELTYDGQYEELMEE